MCFDFKCLHVINMYGCETLALHSYLYALTDLVLFIGSALGVGTEFADAIANGSSLIIAVGIASWIGALLIVSYSQLWLIKLISAGILAIITGLVTGVFARRFGFVSAVRRSAVISAAFLSVATGFIFINKNACISGWQLFLCAITAIIVVEIAAFNDILDLNILDEIKHPFAINIQRTISIGFLISLFVYLSNLSKKVCKQSGSADNTDYIETILEPYTKTVRLLFHIVRNGCEA